MRTEITAGQTSDYLGFDLVMADNLPEPSVLLADRGYDSDNIRKTMEVRDVVPVIPMRKTRKLRVAVDRRLYRLRNLVERCFNKLKNARRVATRYDKTAKRLLSFIDITSIPLWHRYSSTCSKGSSQRPPSLISHGSVVSMGSAVVALIRSIENFDVTFRHGKRRVKSR